MAMYGWIASREGANLDPSVQQSLKPFSKDGGGGPFKFIVDTIADSNGASSKIHTVWIEVYDKETNTKKGEVSVELSDKLDGVSTSEDVTLAMCLTKLGFIDDSHENPPEEDSLGSEQADPLGSVKSASSLRTASKLSNIFRLATLRESLDSLSQD